MVLTNKTPTGLVRGFGGPQLYFALERLVQRIYVDLGIDPLQMYRRNFVPRQAFPYRAAAGALLDSGDYHHALDIAERDGGLQDLLARREQARAAGRLFGIGFAAVVEPSISNMGYITTVLTAEQRAKAGSKNGGISSATVSIDVLGAVSVLVDSAPAGQGHLTVCAQVVADVFGLQPQDVVVNAELDTLKDAWSVAAGNYSSRFAGATAGTAHLAACRLRERMARIAAAQLGCEACRLEFVGGKVQSRDDQRRAVSFTRLAGSAHWSPAQLPEGVGLGLRETVFWTPECLRAPDEQDRVNTSAAYGFVFDMCGVEIDPDTGCVRIDRYVTTHDAGVLLNPALADGQIRGGFAQGVGAALMEELVYGGDGGFQSGTFADYLVPTACEIPEPCILHVETPSPYTRLGAKGLAEGNNMSTPVCIANAVADALGAADVELPLTPSRVMDLLGIDDPAPSAPVAHARAAAGAVPAASTSEGRNRALRATGSVLLEDVAPQAVFDVLLNANALAQVLPGCHALQALGTNRYRADVYIGVGLVKALYAAEIELSDIDPPNSFRLSGNGSSRLGVVRGNGRVCLLPHDRGTRLEYDYEVAVTGKAAAVGSRMLESAARMVLEQLFEQIGRKATDGGTARRTACWGRLLRWLGLHA